MAVSPFTGPHYLLPADKARHVGEAVAVVVAETAAQAADAAEKVFVDYEELPHVTETAKAALPGAPAVWNEVPDNVFINSSFGDEAGTAAAFAAADHVVTAEFRIGHVTAVPIEPRSSLGHFDEETGRYTLYAGSGGAVRQKGELFQGSRYRAEKYSRVLSYDVGGNFGARNRVYVEFGLVLWASKKIGRPVKYTATRSEAFLTDCLGQTSSPRLNWRLIAKARSWRCGRTI